MLPISRTQRVEVGRWGGSRGGAVRPNCGRGRWRRSSAAIRPRPWRSCSGSRLLSKGPGAARGIRGAAAAQPAGAEARCPKRHDRGRGGAPAGCHAGGTTRLLAGDAWRVRQPWPDARHPHPSGPDAQKSGRAPDRDWPEIARQRADWRNRHSAMSAARLVFVDWVGAVTHMARRYGRSPRGASLDNPIPHGPRQENDLWRRPHRQRLHRPLRPRRAMDRPIFRAWTEQMLAPELQPGDIVMLGNLTACRVAAEREAIEARGAELRYLPPYSPTSTRSSRTSRSSRASCARPPNVPGTACGTPSASCSTSSRP